MARLGSRKAFGTRKKKSKKKEGEAIDEIRDFRRQSLQTSSALAIGIPVLPGTAPGPNITRLTGALPVAITPLIAGEILDTLDSPRRAPRKKKKKS